MKIFQKPTFWVLFISLSILGTLFTVLYFPRAFPIVHIHLTMNRKEALQKAAQLSTLHSIGPKDFDNAATFNTDEDVKTFVELDAGGKKAFTHMIQERLYEPYTWHVRHFQEYNVHEVLFRFTPDGKPYGFVETLSEDTPGKGLSPQKAQRIAQETAKNDWNVPIDRYRLVEKAKRVQPNGRIDHTFVYEMHSIRIGMGYYRVRLKVSGNKLTEVTYYIKIPESFTRRYEHMRSANEKIADIARLIMQLIYLIFGCIIGLFFVFRKQAILWKIPCIWAIFVATLETLTFLNQIPLSWMKYDTALSTSTFMFNHLLPLIQHFFSSFVLFLIVFMAAESLTRLAFGNQIQLWKTWSTPIASSFAVLGRTLGGYIIVGIDFAFIVGFYLVTSTLFKWWIPSSSLFDPNILATYIPWLNPLADSLSAGFMEECLFRAVPLASAALLGKKIGKKNLCIGIVFVLQAIIFGAAHANYPAQPAYARLVELLIPSASFGFIYLFFGLLPAIISHFTFDVIWMSLPLFVSKAPGAWINQFLTVFLTLTPLWIVLRARLKTGVWKILPEWAYNKSWKPPLQEQVERKELKPIIHRISAKLGILAIIFGIFAGGLWLFTTDFSSHTLPLTTTRGEAISLTQDSWAHMIPKNKKYTPLATLMYDFKDPLDPEIYIQHRFIWQHDKKLYHTLQGTYLNPVHWKIRLIEFDGDLHNGSKEFLTRIRENKKIFRNTLITPEAFEGSQLSKEDAQAAAEKFIVSSLHIPLQNLKEISAESIKHPKRTDWDFTFHDTTTSIPNGKAYITVSLDGNTISDLKRYVHVPERWDRSEKHKLHVAAIIKQMGTMCLYALFILGILVGIMQLGIQGLSWITFFVLLSILVLLFFGQLINMYPDIIRDFSPNQPFGDQVFRELGELSISKLLQASSLALALALIQGIQKKYLTKKNSWFYIVGFTFGIGAAALYSLVQYMVPGQEPIWPDYGSFKALIPGLHLLIRNIIIWIFLSIILTLTTGIINYVTNFWTHKKIVIIPIGIILAFSLISRQWSGTLHLLLLGTIIFAIAYYAFYVCLGRFSYSSIPLATASFMFCFLVQESILVANLKIATIFTSLMIILLSILWAKKSNGRYASTSKSTLRGG